jgi:hypothetical protein
MSQKQYSRQTLQAAVDAVFALVFFLVFGESREWMKERERKCQGAAIVVGSTGHCHSARARSH